MDEAEAIETIDRPERGRYEITVDGRLAGVAVYELRARRLAARPDCPFMARYIRSHPQYRDLVAS